MSLCLYSTIFTNRGTRRTLCVHEKNDDDDDDDGRLPLYNECIHDKKT